MKSAPLPALHAFIAVARAGQFSRAADALDISASTLSQTIRALEAELGVRLFNRTTRRVALSEDGQRLLDEIGPALAQVDAALETARGRSATPSGHLRINASRTAIALLIAPRLADFLQQWPQITLDVCADDRLSDLVAGGFDAGIRLGETLTAGMVATAIGPPQRLLLVASPAYLAQHGAPRKLADIPDHACIGFRLPGSGRIRPWHFQQGGREVQVQPASRLALNDSQLILQSASAGAGLAQLFEGTVRAALDSGVLTQLLPRHASAAEHFHIYHPSRRQMPPKLRVFIDFLRTASEAASRPTRRPDR